MSLRMSFSQGEDILSSSEYWFLTGMSVALHSSCHTMARKWCGMPLRISSWPGRERDRRRRWTQRCSRPATRPSPDTGLTHPRPGAQCTARSPPCLASRPLSVLERAGAGNQRAPETPAPLNAVPSRPGQAPRECVHISTLLRGPCSEPWPPLVPQSGGPTAVQATRCPSHLDQLLLLASPLLPLVGDPAPQDPRVLLQVAQVGGGRGAGHQRGAAVPPGAVHGAHGLGVGLQEPGQEGPVEVGPIPPGVPGPPGIGSSGSCCGALAERLWPVP